MSLVEIKDFNTLIDIKQFFDQPVKNKQLEEDDGPTMFFIAEKLQRTILNFSLDLLIVTE